MDGSEEDTRDALDGMGMDPIHDPLARLGHYIPLSREGAQLCVQKKTAADLGENCLLHSGRLIKSSMTEVHWRKQKRQTVSVLVIWPS